MESLPAEAMWADVVYLSTRAALTTQQTRLAVVLVQRAAAGDDPLAADRAADLCAVCDLPPKSLWVLPVTDHLSQYAMRSVSGRGC